VILKMKLFFADNLHGCCSSLNAEEGAVASPFIVWELCLLLP
jgi:hypothetical protein